MLNRRNLQNHLIDLFKQVSLQINSFQIDLILKELIVQVENLLLKEQTNAASRARKENSETEEPKFDPRFDALYERIAELEGIVETLTERLERMDMIAKN